MKKLIFTNLFLFIIINASFSQKRLDFFVNGGVYSLNSDPILSNGALSYKYSNRTNYTTGFDLYKITGGGFIYGSKMFLSTFNLNTNFIGSGNENQLVSAKHTQQLTSIVLNPYIGCKINKISFRIGAAFFKNIAFKEDLEEIYTNRTVNYSNDHVLRWHNTGIGFTSSLTYSVNNKLSIELTGSKTYNSLPGFIGNSPSILQINLGIKYKISDVIQKEPRSILSLPQKRVEFFLESGISNRTYNTVEGSGITRKTNAQPAFKAGFDFNKTTKNNFIFGSKLFVSVMNSKTEMNYLPYHATTPEILNLKEQIVGFGINPYIGHQHNKLAFKIGILAIQNCRKKETLDGTVYGHYSQNTTTTSFNSSLNLGIGFSSNISYYLSNKITIEASYLKGGDSDFNTYYGNDERIKFHQFSLGLKYKLSKSKVNDAIKSESL